MPPGPGRAGKRSLGQKRGTAESPQLAGRGWSSGRRSGAAKASSAGGGARRSSGEVYRRRRLSRNRRVVRPRPSPSGRGLSPCWSGPCSRGLTEKHSAQAQSSCSLSQAWLLVSDAGPHSAPRAPAPPGARSRRRDDGQAAPHLDVAVWQYLRPRPRDERSLLVATFSSRGTIVAEARDAEGGDAPLRLVAIVEREGVMS